MVLACWPAQRALPPSGYSSLKALNRECNRSSEGGEHARGSLRRQALRDPDRTGPDRTWMSVWKGWIPSLRVGNRQRTRHRL